MKHNTAMWDRILRAVLAVAAIVCAFVAPLPLLARVLALGGSAAYLFATALAGTCLGYRVMGISTCPVATKRTPA